MRGADSSTIFNITGAGQTQPRDFYNCLRLSKFKTAFLTFLINEWKKPKYASVLQEKRLIVAHGNVAYLYSAHGITIVRDTLNEYISIA